jgi:hypothetical protein
VQKLSFGEWELDASVRRLIEREQMNNAIGCFAFRNTSGYIVNKQSKPPHLEEILWQNDNMM